MNNDVTIPAAAPPADVDTTNAPIISENDILKFFNLESNDIETFSICHGPDGITIKTRLNAKTQVCPVCMKKSKKTKDYVKKRINHSILNGSACYIEYEARRYKCPHCNKIFYENNPFSIGGSRVSIATVYNILKDLKSPATTFTDTARRNNVSTTTVVNIFDKNIHIPRRTLPECLGIDEVYAFKSHNSKYVCVLVDCKNQKVVDILPSRKKDYLKTYFDYIPKEEKERVKYVSFDMWGTYRIIAKEQFPNCVASVDKFHVIQELNKRMNTVRISVQNRYYSTFKNLKKKKELTAEEKALLDEAYKHYYVLKKFNWLLKSSDHKNKIFDPCAEKRFNRTLGGYYNYYDLYDYMIQDDKDLDIAYDLKFEMTEFYRKCTYENAKERLNEIIIDFRCCPIDEMSQFANTLTKWYNEIINSFIIIDDDSKKKMNTAIVENRNKTIKLIKHASNGYQNWSRFRNRVLYSINSDEKINFNLTEGKRY